MKYEGTRPSGKDKDIPVYMFTVGKEELDIIVNVLSMANQYTPDIVETHIYKRRLMTLVKNFGKMWCEVIKNKTVPNKRTNNLFNWFKKHI
jgi:hypothetical protein